MKAILFLISFYSLQSFSQLSPIDKYNKILSENVSAKGSVNYKNLTFFKSELKLLVTEFEKTKVSTLEKKEQLAFFINLYNLHTLNLIVQNYPVKSVKEIDNGQPWDKKRINIEGVSYSLNQLENEIIRKKFNDPRIHFALNCGALSCPPLLNQAYTGKKIEFQLNERTRSFLNNPAFNNPNRISKIFEWYKEDFQNLDNFFAKYVPYTLSKKIEYQEYNWSLNGK